MKTVSLYRHIWIQQFASCPRRHIMHLPYVTFLMSKQCDLEVKKQKQSRGEVKKLMSANVLQRFTEKEQEEMERLKVVKNSNCG